jgi:hypothetical protein
VFDFNGRDGQIRTAKQFGFASLPSQAILRRFRLRFSAGWDAHCRQTTAPEQGKQEM